MKATQMLMKDHRKVEKIIETLLETTAQSRVKRKELLASLKEELQLHEKLEEDLFYPRLKTGQDKEMILEAYQEHHLVDVLLAELEDTKVNDETWKAKLTVLKESLSHHIEEEENEIFPRAEEKLGEEKLNAIGEQIKAAKQKQAVSVQ